MSQSENRVATEAATGGLPFVVDTIFRAFERHSDRVAISWGERTITYAQLAVMCAAMEDALLIAGIARGSLLALYFQDRWLMIPAMLACAAIGCPFAPLDSEIPTPRLRALVESLSLSAIVCDSSVDAGPIFANSTPIISIDVAQKAASDTRQSHMPRRRAAALDSSEFATVYFTSGSTGRPKAIAGRFRGVDAFIQFEIITLGLGTGCRISQLASPSFDAFLKDVFVPLCAGGTVCIPPAPDIVLRPGDLVSWLVSDKVEVLHLVPSIFRRLLEQPLLRNGLPALKAIVLAGEPLRPSDVRQARVLLGNHVTMLHLYGPTETTLTKLYHVVRPEDAIATLVPIGKPMPGTRVCITDERGQVCERGAVGEILITTPYSSLGYLGQPGQTAVKFVPDPEGSRDLTYRTGDLGRLNAQGDYEFVGRLDNQVKVRGVRIEPEEIEAVFSMHEAIAHVVVVPRSDTRGELHLVCYCVLKTPVSTTSLRDFAAARLPRYMLPATIRVVSSLPQNSNGKLDRKAILQHEPLTIAASFDSTELTPTERAVIALFKDVLETSDVDPSESFFVLGGHSLLAIDLLTRVSKTMAVDLSLRDLFEHSTPARLACHIDSLMEVRRA